MVGLREHPCFIVDGAICEMKDELAGNPAGASHLNQVSICQDLSVEASQNEEGVS